MERAPFEVQEDPPDAKVPRPVPGGSYSVESLGSFLDRLLGDARARRMAAKQLEPLLAKKEQMPPEPPPAEIPDPVFGGTEPVTKGDDPH